MARIRTVKPKFWTDAQIAECSPITRLMFIGLWNFCDDHGIHPLSEKQIKLEIFPGDDISKAEIRGMLSELENNGLVKTYTVDNKEYLIVLGWHHQKIDRPSFEYPMPTFDEHSTNNRQTFDDQSTTATPRKVMEGNVREGKGIKELRAREEDLPVDNSDSVDNSPDQKEAFLENQDQVKKPDPLLANLKDVITDIGKYITDPHKQRQVMLFVEANISTKNHAAMMHCLKSLQTQLHNRITIDAPKQYLEVALKIEDGKYNACDHDDRSREFKRPVSSTEMATLGGILAGVMGRASP